MLLHRPPTHEPSPRAAVRARFRLRRLIPAPPARGARTRAPWGFVGMLGLVLVVECHLAWRSFDFVDPVSHSWRFSAAALAGAARGRDVLFLGDSLVKYGLIPQVVDRRAGLRTYNLAVGRAPAAVTYFLLRRALDAGARPEAVVVNFLPELMIEPGDFNLRAWHEFATPREAAELAWVTRSPSLLVRVLLGRLVPSVRCRLEARANVVAALKGDRDPAAVFSRLLDRNMRANGGSVVAAWSRWATHDVTPADSARAGANARFLLPHNLIFAHRFFDLAAARGVRVFWLLPPVMPGVQAARERTGAEARYERFVRTVQARHPGVTVLDARHAGYDRVLFMDPTHLNGRGAQALSLDVADALRRDLRGPSAGSPSPRWVALPPYRGQAADVPLEDTDASCALILGQPLRPRPAG